MPEASILLAAETGGDAMTNHSHRGLRARAINVKHEPTMV